MANKVVQLQNKDGDNLYPLSGGTASDSITTDMLQDGSVTSDKIDFATFNVQVFTGSFSSSSPVTLTGVSGRRALIVAGRASANVNNIIFVDNTGTAITLAGTGGISVNLSGDNLVISTTAAVSTAYLAICESAS